jgi:hypothetical protein
MLEETQDREGMWGSRGAPSERSPPTMRRASHGAAVAATVKQFPLDESSIPM